MKRTLARALVSGLWEMGVRHTFAIPGVHNTELFRSIKEAGIEAILPRHEQGAGFMADGYARASGKPGVCFLVTGPGLSNALTPIGQAHSDSVPLLAISTILPRREVGKDRGLSHDMWDQAGATRSFGDLTLEFTEPSEVAELLGRAFTRFAVQRPRPVILQVPIDRLTITAEDPPPLLPVPGAPQPTAPEITRAADLIRSANRPVIVAGGGAIDCGPALEQLMECSGAAIVTTIAAKGVVPDSHPLSLGSTAPRAATRSLLTGCDLAIVVGSELSVTDFGNDGLPFTGTMLRIDIDPQALSINARPDMALFGEAGTTVDAICEMLEDRAPAFSVDEIERARTASRQEAHTERPGMEAMLKAIRRCLPEETVVTSDMTEIAYLANEVFEMNRPRRWLHPVGFGTLGYALPAAIGAAIVATGTPVASMVGDFGFQYTVAELGVAVERRLPIIIFLWNNEKLHAIEKDMIRKQIEPVAVRGHNPDFLKLAQSYGAASATPDSLGALEETIGIALGEARPTVVELRPENFVS